MLGVLDSVYCMRFRVMEAVLSLLQTARRRVPAARITTQQQYSTLLTSAPRYPKEQCLEGSQASSVCPSDDSDVG